MTTKINLTTTWQQVAEGDCLIDLVARGGTAVPDTAMIVFADDAPAQDTQAYHVLNQKYGLSISNNKETKVFARAQRTTDTIALIIS